MRLIDADALKRYERKIATEAWKMKVKASVESILNQFIDHIDHAPTVDAVPVVRCRNCKSFSHGYCKYHDAKFVRPNGYCYWGERKDGEHEKAD